MNANLNDFLPDIYAGLKTVSRELVGFIPSVTLDATAAGAAVDQTVRSPVPKAPEVVDVVPSMTVPTGDDIDVDYVDMTLSKAKAVRIPWTGEDEKAMSRSVGMARIREQRMAEGMRKLVNMIEADLGALSVKASRSYGTAGTTPFASSLSDPAEIRKILEDNGASISDASLVINTTAGAKLRSLASLNSAGDAGGTDLLRQGIMLPLHGLNIRQSAGVRRHTKGTGANYLVNGAHAAGDTTIALDTGTGTIIAGDSITIGGYNYVVTSALSGGSVTIGAPGLMEAVADNSTVTLIGSHTQNLAFTRSAMVLATRSIAIPSVGDQAVDRTVVTDPVSGLSFSVALYLGYGMAQIELGIVWGVAAPNPEHMAILLG